MLLGRLLSDAKQHYESHKGMVLQTGRGAYFLGPCLEQHGVSQREKLSAPNTLEAISPFGNHAIEDTILFETA